MRFVFSLAVVLSAALLIAVAAPKAKKVPAPSTPQKIDDGYSQKIREYTTEPFFLTEIVDHLPASATVPTPEKVLVADQAKRPEQHWYRRGFFLSIFPRQMLPVLFDVRILENSPDRTQNWGSACGTRRRLSRSEGVDRLACLPLLSPSSATS